MNSLSPTAAPQQWQGVIHRYASHLPVTPATPIVVVSRDDAGFYSKPMLSNALASGKSAAALVMKPAERMAAAQKAGEPQAEEQPERTVHRCSAPRQGFARRLGLSRAGLAFDQPEEQLFQRLGPAGSVDLTADRALADRLLQQTPPLFAPRQNEMRGVVATR